MDNNKEHEKIELFAKQFIEKISPFIGPKNGKKYKLYEKIGHYEGLKSSYIALICIVSGVISERKQEQKEKAIAFLHTNNEKSRTRIKEMMEALKK